MTEPFPADQHDLVRVSDLVPGDTVLIDGVERTICAKDLGRDPLLGRTLWGDSYKSGHKPIIRITYGAELNRRKPMLEHLENLLNLSTDCPCDDWSSIGEYLRGF